MIPRLILPELLANGATSGKANAASPSSGVGTEGKADTSEPQVVGEVAAMFNFAKPQDEGQAVVNADGGARKVDGEKAAKPGVAEPTVNEERDEMDTSEESVVKAIGATRV